MSEHPLNFSKLFDKRPKKKGMSQEFYDDMKKVADLVDLNKTGRRCFMACDNSLAGLPCECNPEQNIYDEAFKKVGYIEAVIPEDCFRHNTATNQLMESIKEKVDMNKLTHELDCE